MFFIRRLRLNRPSPMPPKRARVSSISDSKASVAAKRSRTTATSFAPRKVATAKNAAAVDANPPLGKLLEAVKNQNTKVKKGNAVVYWMRMADLRSAFTYTAIIPSLFQLNIHLTIFYSLG